MDTLLGELSITLCDVHPANSNREKQLITNFKREAAFIEKNHSLMFRAGFFHHLRRAVLVSLSGMVETPRLQAKKSLILSLCDVTGLEPIPK